jgi:hypothetical protein
MSHSSFEPEVIASTSDSRDDAAILNRRARRLTKRQRRHQQESSHAALCPDYFDKLDKRLNTASGGATVYRWALRIVGAVFPVSVGLVDFSDGQLQDTTTGLRGFLIFLSVWAASFPLLAIPLMNYLACVVRPDQHLRAMGVGHIKLSQRAVDNLNKSRMWMRLPRAVFAIVGTFVFMLGFIIHTFPTPYTWNGVVLSIMLHSMGLLLIFAWGHVFDWWLTLRVGSALAADATLEVVLAAQDVSPESDDWESLVVEPSKKLALDIMDELTHGWGRALLVTFATSWLTSLGAFTMVLFTSRASVVAGRAGTAGSLKFVDALTDAVRRLLLVNTIEVTQADTRTRPTTGVFMSFVHYSFLFMTVLWVCVPIAMSRDPAAVSTSCEDLLAELNARRSELLGQGEMIGKIRDLEDYLKNLNNCQGCEIDFFLAGPTPTPCISDAIVSSGWGLRSTRPCWTRSASVA